MGREWGYGEHAVLLICIFLALVFTFLWWDERSQQTKTAISTALNYVFVGLVAAIALWVHLGWDRALEIIKSALVYNAAYAATFLAFFLIKLARDLIWPHDMPPCDPSDYKPTDREQD